MAIIQLDEEKLDEIIRQEVQQAIQNKNDLVNSLINSAIIDEVTKVKDISSKVLEYVDKSLNATSSPLINIIQSKTSKAVEHYLVDKRHTFNNKVLGSIQTSVSDFVNSPEIVKGLIEPWLTKHITESSEFVTYVQSKIEYRLSAKIKSLNNILGENITMPIVKEFLTDYLARRNMKGDSNVNV